MSDLRDSPPVQMGEVLEFMRLLWGLDHGLQKTSKRMEAVLGVTGPQRLVLRIVGKQPGISAGSIASALRLDPSTLTGILHRLQTRGFLGRKPDPEDARRALFRLPNVGVDDQGDDRKPGRLLNRAQ